VGKRRSFASLAIVTSLSYRVDGLRAALLGAAHFGATVDLVAVLVVAVILLDTAAKLFSERGDRRDKRGRHRGGVAGEQGDDVKENKEALCLEVLVHVHGADEGPKDTDSGARKADILAFLRYDPAFKKAEIQKRLMPHMLA
jgi:hypothetical protein